MKIKKENLLSAARKWPPLVSKRGGGIIIVMALSVFALLNQDAEFSYQDATVTKDTTMIMNFLLSKSLLRMSGNGWQINSDPHADGNKFECKWLDFQAQASGKTAKFCGHSIPDGVTDSIAKNKHFHHCNILPGMWKDLESVRTEKSIYVEIGANIGSCVMEMLLSTDANIVAFEPHPRNVFTIRSSIAALDKSYQDRVVIVPVGLGAEGATNTIFAAAGNMGNSVVGMVIKDGRNQQFKEEDQFSIRVERLDSIISTYPDIALIKMDVQGFECHVMDGISQDLANRMNKVKFEVSLNHLRKQGCRDLFAKFRNLGFDLSVENGKKIPDGEHTQLKRMTEMVAIRDAVVVTRPMEQ
jgi:FkbM family methyltransferase